jgi:hypothetical protein
LPIERMARMPMVRRLHHPAIGGGTGNLNSYY